MYTHNDVISTMDTDELEMRGARATAKMEVSISPGICQSQQQKFFVCLFLAATKQI